MTITNSQLYLYLNLVNTTRVMRQSVVRTKVIYMEKALRIDLLIFLSLFMMIPLAADAQRNARRVGQVNPMSPERLQYIEFYEFEQVDVQPEFPGGERGLVNYINNTREYPYNEYVHHQQGRVLCSFIIGTDGRVSHVQVIRSSGYAAFDQEALRVIRKMPRWEAGRMRSSKVNVRCILPIAFRL